ncbi:hypothetical protein AWENTII_006141 [Aspergillus wentii]
MDGHPSMDTGNGTSVQKKAGHPLFLLVVDYEVLNLNPHSGPHFFFHDQSHLLNTNFNFSQTVLSLFPLFMGIAVISILIQAQFDPALANPRLNTDQYAVSVHGPPLSTIIHHTEYLTVILPSSSNTAR